MAVLSSNVCFSLDFFSFLWKTTFEDCLISHLEALENGGLIQNTDRWFV